MNNQLDVVLSEALLPTAQPMQQYVLACSLSQHQTPTLNTLHLLMTLSQRDGSDKWLQITRRLSIHSLQFVFEAYRNDIAMYSGMVEQLFLQNQQQPLSHIVSVMQQQLRLAVHQPTPIGLNVLYQTTADILRYGKDFPQVCDLFLKDPQVIEFMLKRGDLSNSNYLQMAQHLIRRYCELEKTNIASLSLFDFNNYFKYMTDFMGLLLSELLRRDSEEISQKLITLICQSTSMYQVVSQNMPTILQMAMRQLQQYNASIVLTSEPDTVNEVINYECDLLDERTSATKDTMAAELISKLCENIDGALSKFLRTTLEFTLELFNKQSLPTSTQFYKLDTSLSPSTKLQMCYLILCIISKPLLLRDDLTQQLSNFIDIYSKYILTINDEYPIVSFRIIKLIESYCTILKPKQLEQSINLLLRCIKSNGTSLYGQQAFESLQIIFRQPTLYNKIQHCIYDALSQIISILDTTQNVRFVELLTFIVEQFVTPTQRYSATLLKILSRRIEIQTKDCVSRKMQGTHMLLRLFDCFIAIISKKNVLEENYLDFGGLLMSLPELLSDSRRITFDDKILDIAGILVEKGQELNEYVVNCLKYLRGVYEKSYNLSEVHSIIYRCCAYANKFILWDAQQVIRLFSDILIDNISKTVIGQQKGFVDCCYLIMALLQYFQQYFKENKAQRKQIKAALLGALEKCPTPRRQPLEMAIICIYYMKPFRMDYGLIQPRPTANGISKKLYMLYLAFTLQSNYSNARMDSALIYLGKYIEEKLAIQKKKVNNRMQREESEIEEEDQFATPILEFMDARKIKLPLMLLDEIQTFKELLKNLDINNSIDYGKLSDEARRVLKQLPNIIICGHRIRHLRHFAHPTMEESEV